MSQTPGGPTASVAAILAESATRHADRAALLFEDETITYRDLWSQTCTVAGALVSLGVQPGDAVAMMFPNVPDFVRVYYAIIAVGAIVVPVHPLSRSDDVVNLLSISGATLIISDPSLVEEASRGAAATGTSLIVGGRGSSHHLDSIAARVPPLHSYLPMNPLAPATMLFTSGTSGDSKGALLSHFGIIEQTHVALIDALDVRIGDVFGAALPLSHVFGQSNVLNTSFRRGATVALLRRFHPDDCLAELTRTHCTLFAGVPTMLMGLIDAARRAPHLPPLRYVISGGSSLPQAALEEFTSTFACTVHEGYGLSETSPTVTLNHVGERTVHGTVGTPLWGVSVGISEPGRSPLRMVQTGSIGEVVVRGHGVFLGYHGNLEATESAFIDGWLRTGDLGTIDADGRLTIVDRTKDLIIRGGYNIYPREIEEVLHRLPEVESAAVFGIPHDYLGQEVAVAIVSRNPDLTTDTILDHARHHIAKHKQPRVVLLVDALPLGPSGKVLKRELTRRWVEGSLTASDGRQSTRK